MKKSSSHPTPEEWRAWLRGETDESRAEALRKHLDGCVDCADHVQILRQLSRLPLEGPWERPPDDVRSAAYSLPEGRPVDPPDHAPTSVQWAPADVRGGEADTLEDGQIVVGSFADAQLSVVAVPPAGDGLWRIDGRVWLRSPDERPVRIVLCLADHVLAQTACRDGEAFQMEELLGPGWSLEIHLPGGQTYELRDPAA